MWNGRPPGPPPGWALDNGRLRLDDTVAGYAARGQAVRGVCRARGCSRRCWLEYDHLRRRGWGPLPVADVKKTFECRRLDGCGLEFVDDPRTGATPLKTMFGVARARVRVVCQGCGWKTVAAPEALAARLEARGLPGERADLRRLAALMTAACRKCGATRWRVDLLWPDPDRRAWARDPDAD